jgi:hypothetical protein
MGTRSTQTVGAPAAVFHIVQALQSGVLSHECLSEMLQAVSDETAGRGSYNFTIVDGEGPDDAFWIHRL